MTVTERIFELIDEYRNNKPVIGVEGDVLNFDPMMYPELIRIRKELACLALDYAKEFTIYTRAFIRGEGIVEANRYMEQERLMVEEDMAGNKAESIARSSVADEVRKKGEDKALHKTGEIILNQVNEILFAMRQEISIIKKEYESYANQ